MKWKLVLVAALGGVGLGLETHITQDVHLLLCFIPLVAIYVDALCAHLSLRIKMIGEYIYQSKPKSKEEISNHRYEEFIRKCPPRFKLETIALHWSTIFLSFYIIFYGYSQQKTVGKILVPILGECSGVYLFYLSGILGLILTWGILFFCSHRIKIITKYVQGSQTQNLEYS